MLRKAGIFMIAVMFLAVTAGLSFASGILTYRGEGANYFPTAAQTSFNQAYGNSLIDGSMTGIQNGLPTNVFVNPQGLGDLLIYGYYNVRNNEMNVFNVVNTSDRGVRARIRFKEAKNSCEVLDFDVCLSAHDVWHGIITRDASGVGILNATNIDTDTPIAVGDVRGLTPTSSTPSGEPFPQLFPNGLKFKTGSLKNCDSTITPDDTLEGYFIVIAENYLDENGDGTLCGVKGTTDLTDNYGAGDVGNVLFGSNYIISGNDIYAYNATALGDWANQVFTSAPSGDSPDLGDGGDPNVASTLGICPVNFALTKATVENAFYDIGSGTETIVNFPTKKASIGTACDVWDNDVPVGVTIYDDKEDTVTQHCTTSPCETLPPITLPNEVNVVSVNGAKLFDSAVQQDLTTNFSLGYMVIDLTNNGAANRVTTVNDVTTHGIPTVGYVVSNVSDSGLNWMLPVVYTQQVGE